MLAAVRTSTFNRACSLIVLAWFLLVGAAVMWWRPSPMDFPQFYMGGVVAQQGAWSDLYPTPREESWKNPGEPGASTASPGYDRLLDARDIGERFRFIQLPPNAVAFWPMAYLSWPKALVLWTAVMGVFGWMTLRQSANLLQSLLGHQTRLAGVMMLAAAFSPMMIRSVRAGQVSCFVGWAIAVVVTSLALRKNEAIAGIASAAGFIAKYATVFLLPLAIILHRWRLIAMTLIAGSLMILATLPLTGAAPYQAWLERVAPYLGRSHDWDGNQSLQGFLIRALDERPLAASIEVGVRVVRWGALLGVLAVIWLRRRTIRGSAEQIAIAAAGLLAWMAIFSPIFWYHYAPYMLITFGWLWLLIARGGLMRWGAVAVLALYFWPICAEPSLAAPEPLNSLMLWANLLLLLMAMIALCKPRPNPDQP